MNAKLLADLGLIVLTGAIVDLENGDYAIDGPIVDTVP